MIWQLGPLRLTALLFIVVILLYISCNFGKGVSYLHDKACWTDFETLGGSKLALFVYIPK